MKQILQSLKNGSTELQEVPCPKVRPGCLLIGSTVSLISAGTERMLVDFGKAGLLDKARQQPDKVKMVLDKVKTDGLFPTIDAVRSKLDQALPMGYCNVGVVLEVGSSVEDFQVGDRVVSNGNHAEVVCVPKNLCAKIPDGVTDSEAAFTVLSAIALQGVRLLKPTLGECFVVTGLGLIGLITVQLLRANGCRVLGLDYDHNKLELARKLGAEIVDLTAGMDPLASAAQFSRQQGVDGVLITAATKSNEPMHQAAQMCRKRGRIVLVGVTGLELSRADFYEKELTFQVSCSYGPGRYDARYEQHGQDYPHAFVRWTEQRNFVAILDMLASGQLQVADLISHQFDFIAANQAYQQLTGNQPVLGILLKYANQPEADLVKRKVALAAMPAIDSRQPVIGFIGAGNYAARVLIPAFSKGPALLKSIATEGGVSGAHVAKKFSFKEVVTDTDLLFADQVINTVVIATRHDSHAALVTKALQAGKHVFVEKPLCLSVDELDAIMDVKTEHEAQLLMVGFNRRFSPLVVKMKELLDSVVEPKVFIVTVNAGSIPADHWTQDLQVGGGRIIGEACHFIDLLRYLAGKEITDFTVSQIGEGVAVRDDKVTLTLNFSDGSIGSVHYLANGHKSYPKERIEVFTENKVLQLDNFKKLVGFGWPGFKKLTLWGQDKGQNRCATSFLTAIADGSGSPIPLAEIDEVAKVTIEIAKQLCRN